MMAMHSNSQADVILIRVVWSQRVVAWMRRLSEDAASKKMISILFLSIKQAARETLLDKLPDTRTAKITLSALLDQSGQTFIVEWN